MDYLDGSSQASADEHVNDLVSKFNNSGDIPEVPGSGPAVDNGEDEDEDEQEDEAEWALDVASKRAVEWGDGTVDEGEGEGEGEGDEDSEEDDDLFMELEELGVPAADISRLARRESYDSMAFLSNAARMTMAEADDLIIEATALHEAKMAEIERSSFFQQFSNTCVKQNESGKVERKSGGSEIDSAGLSARTGGGPTWG